MTTHSATDPKPVRLANADDSLAIAFRWVGDRYVHEFCIAGEVVLASVDGDSSDAFPPSPPLQQLSSEVLDGREVILGIGAAGRAHWSVSAEVVESTSGRATAIRLDWACRTSADLPNLGTTYANVQNDSVQIHCESGTQLRPCNATPCEEKQRAVPTRRDGATTRWSYLVFPSNA